LALPGLGLAVPGGLGGGADHARRGGHRQRTGAGVQNATDRFETWAYAWTLVFLAGPGIGRWLLGWCATAATWPPVAGARGPATTPPSPTPPPPRWGGV